MKKIIISLISFLIIAVFAFGILYKKEEKNNLEKITLAEVTHSVFYTPLYVADALGYFEKEGIDLNIILTSGADKVAASLISGDAQIGLCGIEQSIYIYNKGSKDYLINISALTKKDGSFIVSRKKEKFELNDLINKHIIAGRPGARCFGNNFFYIIT